jgi:hypothetical protein
LKFRKLNKKTVSDTIQHVKGYPERPQTWRRNQFYCNYNRTVISYDSISLSQYSKFEAITGNELAEYMKIMNFIYNK